MSAELVANELLAFLQQKLDVMDEVSAVQICSTNFSEDDIAAAKLLLFRVLNKSDQMVSRRRDGTKKSLQDIITLLKVTDPDDVPTFVARDLNKLPPVTFDHVDVTSLLKDIVHLKQSLAEMTRRFDASENTVGELRKEVDSLHSSLAVIRSSTTANINVRRGAYFDTSAASFASAVLTSSPASPVAESACAGQTSCASAAPVPAARTPRASDKLRAAAPPAKSTVPQKPRDFATVAASKPVAQQRPVIRKVPSVAPACARFEDRDEEGFIKVQKKRRTQRVNRNRCGTAATGSDVLLRAAVPTTLVYLSRLHYTSKAGDIAEYIRVKSNVSLRVQPLDSSHNASFKAFVVRVPSDRLSTFMQEDYWPKGVVYRRFRGRLPPSPPTV